MPIPFRSVITQITCCWLCSPPKKVLKKLLLWDIHKKTDRFLLLPRSGRKPTKNTCQTAFAIPRKHSGCESKEKYRSEEHTSELQSLMRISYAVFCLRKKKATLNKQT